MNKKDNYHLIDDLPTNLDMRGKPIRIQKLYGVWFAQNKEKRIGELIKVVKSTKDYEDWNSDFTKESLVLLGKWLKENITSRKLTDGMKISFFENTIISLGLIEISNITRKHNISSSHKISLMNDLRKRMKCLFDSAFFSFSKKSIIRLFYLHNKIMILKMLMKMVRFLILKGKNSDSHHN